MTEAMAELTGFAERVVGLEEIGLGTVEDVESYLSWVSERTGPGVADDMYLSLKGAAGAITVRIDEDEFHILLGRAYSRTDEVKAALAHELAHIRQHLEGLFPYGLRYPSGATRAVLLPLEVGAEELVIRELPDVGLERVRMASREAERWERTGDPAVDLDNSLVSVPVALAFERLGMQVKIKHPEVEEPYRTVRDALVRTARTVDPWDRREVEAYCRWAAAAVADMIASLHP